MICRGCFFKVRHTVTQQSARFHILRLAHLPTLFHSPWVLILLPGFSLSNRYVNMFLTQSLIFGIKNKKKKNWGSPSHSWSSSCLRTSLGAQTVKHLSTMWETGVRSLGREDPLEKEMAAHSSILAWKIPWMEEPGGPQSMGSQSWTRLHSLFLTVCNWNV